MVDSAITVEQIAPDETVSLELLTTNLQITVQVRTDHLITWQEPPNCTTTYTKLYQPIIVCKAERHNLERSLSPK